MIQPKLKIALIGLGAIAQKAYLPVMANHAAVDPVLCTRNLDVLSEFSKKYRIDSCYSTIDDLLLLNLDAAMVHTSTESHYTIVHQLVEAGIPTFVDKPLALSFAETKKLIQLATQKQVNLYLGFNRRFVPLVQKLKKQKNIIYITWQKNRLSLPAEPRDFIYNDFIHVVDSLRFLGSGKIADLQVFSRVNKGLLESIEVRWQQGETLLTGRMNRVSGTTEERVELQSPGNTWLLDGLHTGLHYQNGNTKALGFDHWESTLQKRGFVNMIEDWLRIVQNRKFEAGRIQDILETHKLCEQIIERAVTSV